MRTAIATVLSLLPFAAQAEISFKPYVGVDYQYTNVNYQDYPALGINGGDLAEDDMHGFNIHAGARLHQNFGIEAGFSWSESDDKNNILGTGINSQVSVYGANLDALGYIPVTEKFELIGTVGLSYLTAKIDFSGAATATDDESEIKGRIGAGAQYWITENINARGIVRYQGADFDDSADGAVVANIGLNYQF
jgi:opacity protein-like surface antigen